MIQYCNSKKCIYRTEIDQWSSAWVIENYVKWKYFIFVFQRREKNINMMRKPTCSNVKYLNKTHRDIYTIINVVELLKFM